MLLSHQSWFTLTKIQFEFEDMSFVGRSPHGSLSDLKLTQPSMNVQPFSAQNPETSKVGLGRSNHPPMPGFAGTMSILFRSFLRSPLCVLRTQDRRVGRQQWYSHYKSLPHVATRRVISRFAHFVIHESLRIALVESIWTAGSTRARSGVVSACDFPTRKLLGV